MFPLKTFRALDISGTNVSVERIFSITNILWIDEKN